MIIRISITILGTGTSQGVPVIGCQCEVCQSSNPKDKRLRTSIIIENATSKVLIDCGPDFRQQMLRENIQTLNAIVLTHEHNDHVIGLDDVRPFNFMQREAMTIYAKKEVGEELRKRFAYVFAEKKYPGAPQVHIRHINKNLPFEVEGIPFTPIEVLHGKLPVLGFRIKDFTYLTDIKTIAPEELEKVFGTKYLIISALHHKPHYSHLSLGEAISIIQKVNPKHAFITHISHRMGLYDSVSKILPSNISLAYDGMRIELES